MALADEKYMAFTTYRKDGTPKPGPVWPVDAGEGRVGFITSSQSWKVKRIANSNRVAVQPSDSRGRTKDETSPRSGTAEVVEGADFDAIHAKVREKYGFQLTLINAFHSLQRLIGRGGHPQDRAVIVTLDDA
ncbi:MAG: PPOX class F420-dependent oxidoreductase [Acidimicrobiia bacterium]|nr:PPOX class F420-dependent oxidoreductase [Acidimicrobiia bacterium]